MSKRDMWTYNPDVRDGDFCPMNCDRCPKAEDAQELENVWQSLGGGRPMIYVGI